MSCSELCGIFLLLCAACTVAVGFLTGLRQGLLVLGLWAFLFAWAAAEASRDAANHPLTTKSEKP